jgi:hypothetical protein
MHEHRGARFIPFDFDATTVAPGNGTLILQVHLPVDAIAEGKGVGLVGGHGKLAYCQRSRAQSRLCLHRWLVRGEVTCPIWTQARDRCLRVSKRAAE